MLTIGLLIAVLILLLAVIVLLRSVRLAVELEADLTRRAVDLPAWTQKVAVPVASAPGGLDQPTAAAILTALIDVQADMRRLPAVLDQLRTDLQPRYGPNGPVK